MLRISVCSAWKTVPPIRSRSVPPRSPAEGRRPPLSLGPVRPSSLGREMARPKSNSRVSGTASVSSSSSSSSSAAAGAVAVDRPLAFRPSLPRALTVPLLSRWNRDGRPPRRESEPFSVTACGLLLLRSFGAASDDRLSLRGAAGRPRATRVYLPALVSTAGAAGGGLPVENQSSRGRCRDLALPLSPLAPPPLVCPDLGLPPLLLRLTRGGCGAADGLSSRRKQHFA